MSCNCLPHLCFIPACILKVKKHMKCNHCWEQHIVLFNMPCVVLSQIFFTFIICKSVDYTALIMLYASILINVFSVRTVETSRGTTILQEMLNMANFSLNYNHPYLFSRQKKNSSHYSQLFLISLPPHSPHSGTNIWPHFFAVQGSVFL